VPHRSRRFRKGFLCLLLAISPIDILLRASASASRSVFRTLFSASHTAFETQSCQSASGKIFLIASSNSGRSSVIKIRTLRTPHPLRSLGTSSQFLELSSSAPKSQNLRISLRPLGSIPRATYAGSLALFPR